MATAERGIDRTQTIRRLIMIERKTIAAIALSATAFVALLTSEGYSEDRKSVV